MSEQHAAYEGAANLEVMECARNYNSWLRNQVTRHVSAGANLLDFGAGTGTFAKQLRMAGYDVTCVELDPELRARLKADGFITVAECSELSGSGYDLVYSLNVLEHISDDAAAIRSMVACLNFKARLVIYVPAFEVLYSSMDIQVGHVRRYTAARLAAIAASEGLAVLEIRHVDSLGFFAALAYRYIGANDGVLNVRAVQLYDRLVFPISSLLDRVFGRFFGKNLLMVAIRAR